MSQEIKRKIKSREELRKRRLKKRRQRAQLLVISISLAIVLLSGILYMIFSDQFKVKDENQTSDKEIVNDENSTDSDEVVLEIDITPPSIEASFTISAVGDCTLGYDKNYGYGNSFMEKYDNTYPAYFFEKVKSIFENDDLTIANLEGPLTDSTAAATKQFAFRGDPSFSQILTEGSVEAVNLANNHTYDYGQEGVDDTKATLETANITAFGYDNVQVVTINDVQVGLVGVYELSKGIGCKEDLIKNQKVAEDAGAEVIITSFHWGDESKPMPTDVQVELAHAAIDNGADLVIGHHPHVLQGIELYKDRYILYSLGNFSFGGNKNPSDKDTIIYQQTFTVKDGELLPNDSINIIPCSISSTSSHNNFQPMPLTGDEKTRVANKLQERSMTDILPYIQE